MPSHDADKLSLLILLPVPFLSQTNRLFSFRLLHNKYYALLVNHLIYSFHLRLHDLFPYDILRLTANKNFLLIHHICILPYFQHFYYVLIVQAFFFNMQYIHDFISCCFINSCISSHIGISFSIK